MWGTAPAPRENTDDGAAAEGYVLIIGPRARR
eukprot:COSAG02_NODE_65953_length_256_cov_1.649682_1_plen_31_part_01